MFVEWNDHALASVEWQPETYQSARGDTHTKLTPRSWEWFIYTHVHLTLQCFLPSIWEGWSTACLLISVSQYTTFQLFCSLSNAKTLKDTKNTFFCRLQHGDTCVDGKLKITPANIEPGSLHEAESRNHDVVSVYADPQNTFLCLYLEQKNKLWLRRSIQNVHWADQLI